MLPSRIPKYHVIVDESKTIAKDSDARRIEILLNTVSELSHEYETRNHTRGNMYFYRLQDKLMGMATEELGLIVERTDLQDTDHHHHRQGTMA